MSVGSGLAAQLGIAAESTYGTYVAPTRFLEFDKHQLRKKKNAMQGGGLAAGRFAQLAGQRVVTTVGGEGPLDMEVKNAKMGLLLSHIFGSTPTVVQQGATAAYLQTHAIGDNVGKYLSVQAGVPDTAGTVRPYSFLGGKVTSAEFTCKLDDTLDASINFDFRDVTEAQGLAAPSYTAEAPFHFGQMNVKLGATYGSEASVSGVKGISVKIERGQATDRYYAGAAGLKAEPIMNDWVKISGSVDADLVDKTIWADRFAADTQTAMVLEWVGPIIASTFAYTFRLKLPAIFLDGDTPDVEGPDITSGSFPFVAQFDGTNPLITCEYMSIDTAI
jgi:hypothetical protein